MMSNTRTLIEEIYTNHTNMVFSEAIEHGKDKAVIYGSLHRRPAKVFMLILPDGAKTPISVAFNDKAGKKSDKKRRSDITKVAEQILAEGAYKSLEEHGDLTRVPASQIIDDLGLFGAKASLPGQIKSSFQKEMEKVTKDPEERDAIMAAFKMKDLIESDMRRLRKPFRSMKVFGIHPETPHAVGAMTEYDWASLRFYSMIDDKGMLRRQAAQAFPILAGFFPSNASWSRTVIDTQLDPVVENRKHLDTELGKIFGVKGKTLKRMKGISFPSNGLTHDEIIEACSSIPSDWIPKTQEDWDSFTLLVRTVGRKLGSELKSITPNPYEYLFKGSKGKWREFHKRCVIAISEQRPPQGLRQEAEQKAKNLRGNLKDSLQADQATFKKKIEKGLSKIDFINEAQKKDVFDWLMEMHDPDMSEGPMTHAAQATLDMINFVSEEVCLPAAAIPLLMHGQISVARFKYTDKIRKEVRRAAMMLTICPDVDNPSSGKAMPNVFEATRIFLNNINNIQSQLFETAEVRPTLDHIEEGHWPPLFHGQFEIDDEYYFEAVTSPDRLLDEGRGKGPNGTPGSFPDEPRRNADLTLGLNHCVGRYYSPYCQRTEQQIVSLRKRTPNKEAAFERIGTLQVFLPHYMQQEKYREGTIPEIQPGDFYGEGNTFLEDKYQAMKETFIQAMKAGDASLNTAELSLYKHIQLELPPVEIRDPVKDICLYDWKDPKNIQTAMFAVGRLIHRDVTKSVKNVSDLVKHKCLDELLIHMDPDRSMEAIGLAADRKSDTAPVAMTASGRRMF